MGFFIDPQYAETLCAHQETLLMPPGANSIVCLSCGGTCVLQPHYTWATEARTVYCCQDCGDGWTAEGMAILVVHPCYRSPTGWRFMAKRTPEFEKSPSWFK